MNIQKPLFPECGHSDSQNLNDQQVKDLCQVAIFAVKTAGMMIAEQRGKQLLVEHKENVTSLASSVFTEVDLMAEKIILDTLRPSCEEFDLALLSEESPDDGSRFEKDYFWCVDPLDGSLPFISGSPGFSVSVALVSREGEAVIGVIYDPIEDVLYHAIKGQGAFRNQQFWSLTQSSKAFTLYNDRSFKKLVHFEALVEQFKELSESLGYTKFQTNFEAGAVINAISVLESPAACYFKLPRKDEGGGSIWDYAATVCIFEELGAVVTNFDGNKLDLNRRESTKLNHKGVIFASDRLVADETLQKLSVYFD